MTAAATRDVTSDRGLTQATSFTIHREHPDTEDPSQSDYSLQLDADQSHLKEEDGVTVKGTGERRKNEEEMVEAAEAQNVRKVHN